MTHLDFINSHTTKMRFLEQITPSSLIEFSFSSAEIQAISQQSVIFAKYKQAKRLREMKMEYRKYLRNIEEWGCFTMVFFFLYDVIWILADYDNFLDSFKGLYWWLLIDFAYCGIFSFTSIVLNRKLFTQRWFKQQEEGYNFVIRNGIVILVVNMLIAGGCELLLNVLLPIFQDEDIWGTSFLFGLVASLVALIHLSMHYADLTIRKGKENIALQKKYLKLQLDSHFMFNSLSSLAGMIEEDPHMAEEYTVRLSHIYRHILRHIDRDYISISEGIAFIRAYVEMLNMRYDNSICLSAEGVWGEDDEHILSLSLQLLIENAVKHNYPQRNEKLRIEISRQGNMLTIRNNRIYTHGRNGQNAESYGIGISNLQQRYKLECTESIKVNASPEYFEVILPIIKRTTQEQ